MVGYMRVSTAEQSLTLQRDALEDIGCERLYEDICSGAVIGTGQAWPRHLTSSAPKISTCATRT